MDGKAVSDAAMLINLDGNLPANRDIAMVNISLAIKGKGGSSGIGQLRHVLLWNVDLQTQPLLLYPIMGPVGTFGAVGCIFADIAPLDGQPTNTFKWDSNQFTGGILYGVNGVKKSANYDMNYNPQSPAEITKRTVRWGLGQEERNPPYRCGAHASPRQPVQTSPGPTPVQGVRIIR
jgi:hypothetical protein